MTGGSKPNDIARETLRLLIAHGEAATPENYRRRYREIAGSPGDESGHAAENMLRELAAAMPRTTPELARAGSVLASATAHHQWDKALSVLLDLAKQHDDGVAATDWAHVLREVVRLLRENQFGISSADKRAALDKALAGGADARTLYARLAALVAAWTQLPITVTIAAADFAAEAADRRRATHGEHEAQPTTSELRELLAQTLEVSIATHLIDAPGLAEQATGLAHRLRAAAPVSGTELRDQLRALWTEIGDNGRQRDEVQAGLMRLLRLLVENIGTLVADDQWLRGQIALVLQAISSPLNLDAIEQALRNLQNVILRQSLVKQSLYATKAALKDMVASFIDELGKLSAATGDYHDCGIL